MIVQNIMYSIHNSLVIHNNPQLTANLCFLNDCKLILQKCTLNIKDKNQLKCDNYKL